MLELNKEYKFSELTKEKICGIYKIIHKPSGKVYIGRSVDICQRAKTHLIGAKSKRTCPRGLSIKMIKLGIDDFMVAILEFTQIDRLNEREAYYIRKHKSTNPDFGFNHLIFDKNNYKKDKSNSKT